ncbi:MAG: c-type cytochrome [bacterium]|jgi:mono/diheme cytochrome c family protein
MFRWVELLKKTLLVGALMGLSGVASAGDGLVFGYGTAISPGELAGWDISINQVGEELPEGVTTPEEGENLYLMRCAQCHGEFGEAVGRWPVLASPGAEETLATLEPIKTVGSYWPYATTLFSYIRRAMPFYEPQSLSAEETYAITAYVLHLNDLLEYDEELNREKLISMEMPNQGNFIPDNRPDTQNAACMSGCPEMKALPVIR